MSTPLLMFAAAGVADGQDREWLSLLPTGFLGSATHCLLSRPHSIQSLQALQRRPGFRKEPAAGQVMEGAGSLECIILR